jgi:DNA polymerase III epsilon subunit-like protein
MRIFFFDTETTGNTTKDFLCQLAIKERGVAEPIINAMYKPPVPIPIECTMIHHISNKMVADRPSFKESPEYQTIKELFESPDTICVAHNAAFDAQILRNDDIEPTNLICTFKAIRALDGDGKFAMHKLQYLRYALEMELDVPAHDAYADVLVLEQLFDYELPQAVSKWNMPEEDAIKEMIEITKQPLTIRGFDFGKYKGKSIAEVASMDPGYLSWLLDQKKQSTADESDWIYTLEKHLGLQ